MVYGLEWSTLRHLPSAPTSRQLKYGATRFIVHILKIDDVISNDVDGNAGWGNECPSVNKSNSINKIYHCSWDIDNKHNVSNDKSILVTVGMYDKNNRNTINIDNGISRNNNKSIIIILMMMALIIIRTQRTLTLYRFKNWVKNYSSTCVVPG